MIPVLLQQFMFQSQAANPEPNLLIQKQILNRVPVRTPFTKYRKHVFKSRCLTRCDRGCLSVFPLRPAPLGSVLSPSVSGFTLPALCSASVLVLVPFVRPRFAVHFRFGLVLGQSPNLVPFRPKNSSVFI